MIALIDYDAGNTCSVMNALKRVGVEFILTDQAAKIRNADKVIFPGVGHAASAMRALQKKNLDELIPSLTQPVLGICVGLQLMCESSEEGNVNCLGIIPGRVKRFDESNGIKVPHMGWNTVHAFAEDPIWRGVQTNDHFYFVHSYYVPQSDYAIATCEYDVSFAAAIRKDNFWGVQFHAEKSGDVGERVLRNFLEMNTIRK